MLVIETTHGFASIPQSWYEVTIEEFYFAWTSENIGLLIKTDSDEARQLTLDYLDLSFDAIPIAKDCVNVDKVVNNFGKMRWWRFIQLENAISKKDAIGIIGNFADKKQLAGLPTPKVVNALMQILNAYHGFLSNFKMEAMYSQQQINAGVQDLNKLGSWISISEIARDYGLNPNIVLKWDISTVYVDMYTRYKVAEYTRALNEQNQK
jgi:hypothetical protein